MRNADGGRQLGAPVGGLGVRGASGCGSWTVSRRQHTGAGGVKAKGPITIRHPTTRLYTRANIKGGWGGGPDPPPQWC